jgi:hypothetical protein
MSEPHNIPHGDCEVIADTRQLPERVHAFSLQNPIHRSGKRPYYFSAAPIGLNPERIGLLLLE